MILIKKLNCSYLLYTAAVDFVIDIFTGLQAIIALTGWEEKE